MSVAKRVISLPERHAATVAAIAQRVTARWPKVEAVAAAQAPPTLRASGSRDGGRSSEHPDPTATIALGHGDYDDLREAVQAWLEQGKWIEARQVEYLRHHPETHAAKTDDLKSLCTVGGCDFRAERTGLCWKHYRLHLAAEALHTPEQAVCDTSTLGVVEHPYLRATPPRHSAAITCGCGWQSPEDVDDDEAMLFHRLKKTLDAHKAEWHAEKPPHQ